MRLIAHRGNTKGSNRMENHPDYLLATLEQGYDVEIDVWKWEDHWYFGHDMKQYEVTKEDIWSRFGRYFPNLWLHAKNYDALVGLHHSYGFLNYFWHNTDTYTITSKGFFWTEKPYAYINTVYMNANMGNAIKADRDFYAVCSDHVEMIREKDAG